MDTSSSYKKCDFMDRFLLQMDALIAENQTFRLGDQKSGRQTGATTRKTRKIGQQLLRMAIFQRKMTRSLGANRQASFNIKCYYKSMRKYENKKKRCKQKTLNKNF